jgi:hypothetical protein
VFRSGEKDSFVLRVAGRAKTARPVRSHEVVFVHQPKEIVMTKYLIICALAAASHYVLVLNDSEQLRCCVEVRHGR